MSKVSVVFLGRHYKDAPKWFKIVENSGYRVGDGYHASTEKQYAFGCPRNLEVTRVHTFEEEDGFTCDRDLITLDEFIENECDGLTEIYDD